MKQRPERQMILVGAQPAFNITPLLDPKFRPDEVTLLVSPDMQQRAGWVTEVLQQNSVRVTHWPVDDPWHIVNIRDRVLDWLVEHDSEVVALNASGGTRAMSIAAYEAFRSVGQPVFYVHPERDQVIWLYPASCTDSDILDRIKLEPFLQANGARVVNQGSQLGVPEGLQAITSELVKHVKAYAKPLSALNWAAQSADNPSLLSQPLPSSTLDSYDFQLLIDLFEKEKLLSQEGAQFRFQDQSARFFANGGWLEDHLYRLCLGLKKSTPIQDVRRGIEVEREIRSQPVRNELDVAFLANNRLYIIECKTKRFEDGSAGSEALFKLDTLTDLLGGLHARGMLVSFQPLREVDLRRAADLQIEVCCGPELAELTSRLEQWVE